MRKDSIFLTIEQAVDAVRMDLRHYPPQIMLASGLIHLVSEGRIASQRCPGENSIWIGKDNTPNMQRLDGQAAMEYLCTDLITAAMGPEKLAAVCSRVFRTRALPENDAETGKPGIRIETGMEAFSCRQCGRCCRNLDYHSQLTPADVKQWRELGREDILAWVDIQKEQGEETGYRIWVAPETHQYADPCPFLKKDPTANRWICTIHDVKPGICRNYPVSRKHAAMTGCPGFDKKTASRPSHEISGRKKGRKKRHRH